LATQSETTYVLRSPARSGSVSFCSISPPAHWPFVKRGYSWVTLTHAGHSRWDTYFSPLLCLSNTCIVILARPAGPADDETLGRPSRCVGGVWPPSQTLNSAPRWPTRAPAPSPADRQELRLRCTASCRRAWCAACLAVRRRIESSLALPGLASFPSAPRRSKGCRLMLPVSTLRPPNEAATCSCRPVRAD
jgi:hypothetical protein